MKKIDMMSIEEMMKEFDLTEKEVESMTEEFYINTPGIVKIDGEYYWEDE